MANKSSFGEVNLDVEAGAQRRIATELDPDAPFRILLIGNFSGRGDRTALSAADFRPVPVDRDNFEEVLQRIEPGLAGLRFRDLDDFHPARIFQSKLFEALREVRQKLQEPATFREAADEVRGWGGKEAAEADAIPAEPLRPPVPQVKPGGSLLDAIVDAVEPPRAAPARRDTLQAFVESVVGPQDVVRENRELPKLLKLVDAECGERMRAILHHPSFQSQEAAWRGVFHAIRAIETGSDLKVYLLNISKAELAVDLNAAEDIRESGMWRMLVEEAAEDTPWSVVAGNYTFAQTAGDAQILRRMGKIMSAAGAPFVAEADPGNGSEEGAREWEALRQSPEAAWIGLAMPRFLLRMPYGKTTDAVESFEFEEMAGAPEHAHYLWGNPALLCVELLAEAFADDGWQMRAGSHSEIGGLPLHVYGEKGEKHVKPCAEVLLTDRDIEWMMEQGYMALDSKRERDVVRLVRFQSIAKPLGRLSGRWG